MKIDELKSKIDEYESTQIIIQKNREVWQGQTKPILIDTLNKITEVFPIGWQVQVNDWTKNSEGINISFGAMRSGIIGTTEKSFRSYIKNGGTITFSQAYNGEIFVIILYPSVEEIVSEAERKILGKFSPDKITEEFIVKKVSEFLEEMIKWEKSTYGNSIGFKI